MNFLNYKSDAPNRIFTPEELKEYEKWVETTETEFLEFLQTTKMRSVVEEKEKRKTARIKRLGYDDGLNGEYTVVKVSENGFPE